LHDAVRAYVDAVNERDLGGLVASFADDAEIVDVSRRITGRQAIRNWADREVIGGTLDVLAVDQDRTDGQVLLVRFAPGGTGGFRAYYNFSVADGQIVVADLQYA
jgi:ketosteroid isomerase-like protein